MRLCQELGGMTLAEMEARMGAYELLLWKERARLLAYVERQRERNVGEAAALEFARNDYRRKLAERGLG